MSFWHKKKNRIPNPCPNSCTFLFSIQIQQQLLTTTSATITYVLSVCCLRNASEIQPGMKIPSASWPAERETFLTHYVLMPSPQCSQCILVKERFALSALPSRHAGQQRQFSGAFSVIRWWASCTEMTNSSTVMKTCRSAFKIHHYDVKSDADRALRCTMSICVLCWLQFLH